MKKTMRLLSMAALALVGAVMTGCSSDDNIIDQPQQPETPNNVVTLTTTVSLGDGDATTRALTSTGVKTFAEGETMAIIYKNTSNQTVKAVSEPLPAGDYGASATFTFTLEDPSRAGNVTYIYPAAMASTTDVDYSALNSQNGSLATLSSNLDLATYSGAWDGASLPSATLTNQLAILALKLKNEASSSDITSSITRMTLKAGDNTYTVSPSSLSTIYVAIRPTSSATIDVTATDGTNEYGKTLSGKTYAANNGYNVTWNMSKMTTITWNSSNISDLAVEGTYISYTKEGITLSANVDQNGASWFDHGDRSGIIFNTHESGGFAFTAPTGKKFTKIEMTLTGPEGWDRASIGTGWTFYDYIPEIVTWTGTAATTVDLLTGENDFDGVPVKSIVFTVY